MKTTLNLVSKDEFAISEIGTQFQSRNSEIVINVVNIGGKTRFNVNGDQYPSDFVKKYRGSDDETFSAEEIWTRFGPLFKCK